MAEIKSNNTEIEVQETMLHIEYECPKCGETWDDYHTSAVDSDCPNEDTCGCRDITPLTWTECEKSDTNK